jgi:arginase
VLVDARDLDPPEKEYLRQAKMRHVALDDLETLPDGPLYVHLDLDIVDPSELPDVRYPAPGGPSLAAVVESMHTLFETGRVVGAGIACTWAEGTDFSDETRALLNDILPELT